jgi:leucyl aminopeptidase
VIRFRADSDLANSAAVIFFTEEELKSQKYPAVGQSLKKSIHNLAGSKRFQALTDTVFPVMSGKTLVLLAGLGPESDQQAARLRTSIRKGLTSEFLKGAPSVEIIFANNSDHLIHAAVEAVALGTYAWNKYRTCRDPGPDCYTIVAPPKAIYKKWAVICEGVNLARDLVNDNADVVNSVFIEEHIRKIVKDCAGARLETLNKKELKKEGLRLHLAVNQGSRNEPKLLVVRYSGAGKDQPYTALIGKGITFDTGGLNLKPTGSIETMKMDMGGAAAVIGALRNTVKLNLKVNAVFAVGLAENVTGSGSYKPGDVITGHAGKSVEIGNTDAEGRLVLADAISYVKAKYRPKRIIDIATLTGACITALGHDFSGLVSTDEPLAEQILRSARITDDWVWRLPNYPQLKESVKSQIADIRNIAYPKGAGGAITAAEFLRQFAEGDGVSWAHLDIAGTCYAEGHGRLYFGFGATGAGVRLLTSILEETA